jgi:hypothetical protein
MQSRLTWNDLLVQKISEANARDWLSCWQEVIRGKVVPICMSKFGDWFLQLPDGKVNELSVIEGTYKTIASSPKEFSVLVNSPKWQEEHLMSLIVQQLHERNLVPPDGQCYAFAPHPILLGRIAIENAMLMDIVVWQSICSQTINISHEELKTV